MGTFQQDLRYTLRALLRNPGFLATATLTLALGVGANTAIFSALNSIELRPLPYPDAESMVTIMQKRPDGVRSPASGRIFEAWRRHATSFVQMEAAAGAFYNLTGWGDPEHMLGVQVTPGLLTMLGARTAVGRVFAPDEGDAGKRGVVVISHDFWIRHFGGARDLIDKSITLNEKPFKVIGVLAPNFRFFTNEFAVFTPMALERAYGLHTYARRKPGVSIEQARIEMEALAKRLESEFSDMDKGWSVTIRTFKRDVVEDTGKALYVLLGAVSLVLLIACVNVANLLLTRALGRQREMAVRAALGAGQGRLLRHLLTESLMLSLFGSGLGLLLAYGLIRAFVALNPSSLPRVEEIHLDGRVLLFTLAISLITGVLFGLFPARHVLKTDLNTTLKEGGRSSSGGVRGRRSRMVLLVSEVALSLVLLIGASMLLRSFLRLQTLDRGFQKDHLLTMRMSILPRYDTQEKMLGFYTQMLNRIKALPEVDSVGVTTSMPVDGNRYVSMYFSVPGRTAMDGPQRPIATTNLINPDFPHALRLAVKRGRAFTWYDRKGAPLVAMVSESLAKNYWPGEDPIGRRIVVGAPGSGAKSDTSREIVGVLADVQYPTRKAEDSQEIYLPALQGWWPNLFLLIRTRTDPASVAGRIRGTVREIDPDQAISNVQTMDDRLLIVNETQRWTSLLLAVFAGVAVALAAVGIYGLISFTASQQKQEISVRIALGAEPRHILTTVLRQALLVTALGIAIGLGAYLPLMRFLKSQVYGISASDAGTLIGASVLLIMIAAFASYVPARRATQLDPAIVLRGD